MTTLEAKTIQWPDPGIYYGLPEAQYHALDVCSNSRLNALNVDPEDCADIRANPMKSSDAMRLGTAVHTLVLEPAMFDDRHAVFIGDKRTNKAKAEWAAMADRIGEDNIIKEAEYATALAMSRAIDGHPAASSLLTKCSEQELSIIYDADLGDLGTLRMKARLDGVAPDVAGGVMFDLKTARDVSEKWFRRAVYDRGYFRQVANYRAALRAHGRDINHAGIVAVQNTAIHEIYKVRFYRILEDVIDAGERDLMRLMRDYQQREQSGDWTGDGGKAIDLDLSTFAWRELENNGS